MEATADGHCMIKTESVYPFVDQFERVILYRWDTDYLMIWIFLVGVPVLSDMGKKNIKI